MFRTISRTTLNNEFTWIFFYRNTQIRCDLIHINVDMNKIITYKIS